MTHVRPDDALPQGEGSPSPPVQLTDLSVLAMTTGGLAPIVEADIQGELEKFQ